MSTEVNVLEQVYAPNTDVVVSSNFLNAVISGLATIRENRIAEVIGLDSKPIGFTLHPNDRDIEQLMFFVMSEHEKHIKEGKTVAVSSIKTEEDKKQTETEKKLSVVK